MGSRRWSAPATASSPTTPAGTGAVRAGARAGRLRLRRPRRRPRARCSTSSASSAPCSPARRWARTRSRASRSSTPSASRRRSSSSRPAFDPGQRRPRPRRAGTRSPTGLRTGGVEGFVEAYGDPGVPEAWRDTVVQRPPPAPGRARAPRGGRRRAARRPALAAVRRARRPGGDRGARRSSSPSRDEADPGHPLERGRGATRDASRRRAAAQSRSRARRRSRGRAASSRRSSPSSRVPSDPLRSVPRVASRTLLGGVQNGASEGSRRSPFRGTDVSDAGYSGTPLPKKLGFKPGMRAHVDAAPPELPDLLGELDGVTWLTRPARPLDIVLLFVTERRELARRVARCRSASRRPGCCGSAGPSGRRACPRT